MTFTDDDTKANFIGHYSDSFDADGVGDRDPMYDDAPGNERRRKCTCGALSAHADYQNDPRGWGDDAFPWHAFNGCRGCDPTDHELKPRGFGIESYECQRALDARRELWLFFAVGGGKPVHDRFSDIIRTASLNWAGFSLRRERHSDIVWNRLCDGCETHSEAKAAYERWAKRAVTVRYRDERAAPIEQFAHLEAA